MKKILCLALITTALFSATESECKKNNLIYSKETKTCEKPLLKEEKTILEIANTLKGKTFNVEALFIKEGDKEAIHSFREHGFHFPETDEKDKSKVTGYLIKSNKDFFYITKDLKHVSKFSGKNEITKKLSWKYLNIKQKSVFKGNISLKNNRITFPKQLSF